MCLIIGKMEYQIKEDGMSGLSYGDTVLIDGKRVDFNKQGFICEKDGFTDTIIRGGGYSASTTLLDISCDAGRYGLVDELEGVKKVGHFKGATLARYLERYLRGDYEKQEEIKE